MVWYVLVSHRSGKIMFSKSAALASSQPNTAENPGLETGLVATASPPFGSCTRSSCVSSSETMLWMENDSGWRLISVTWSAISVTICRQTWQRAPCSLPLQPAMFNKAMHCIKLCTYAQVSMKFTAAKSLHLSRAWSNLLAWTADREDFSKTTAASNKELCCILSGNLTDARAVMLFSGSVKCLAVFHALWCFQFRRSREDGNPGNDAAMSRRVLFGIGHSDGCAGGHANRFVELHRESAHSVECHPSKK
jgi:hypothetical protein